MSLANVVESMLSLIKSFESQMHKVCAEKRLSIGSSDEKKKV